MNASDALGPAPQRPAVFSSANANGAARVFICSDDPAERFRLSQHVQASGELVVVGAAGDDAAALIGIRATQPDVVLVDQLMPGFEHVGMLGRIRVRAPEAKVILQRSREAPANQDGADGYLDRADPPRQLRELVKALVQARS